MIVIRDIDACISRHLDIRDGAIFVRYCGGRQLESVPEVLREMAAVVESERITGEQLAGWVRWHKFEEKYPLADAWRELLTNVDQPVATPEFVATAFRFSADWFEGGNNVRHD